jgi:hypothetical protein
MEEKNRTPLHCLFRVTHAHIFLSSRALLALSTSEGPHAIKLLTVRADALGLLARVRLVHKRTVDAGAREHTATRWWEARCVRSA